MKYYLDKIVEVDKRLNWQVREILWKGKPFLHGVCAARVVVRSLIFQMNFGHISTCCKKTNSFCAWFLEFLDADTACIAVEIPLYRGI